MEYLFTIKEPFQISGLGCVIVSIEDTKEIPTIHVGDELVLVDQKEEKKETKIKSIPMISYRKVPDHIPLSLQLEKNVNASEIAEGTKVYRLNRSEPGGAGQRR